MMKPCSSSSSSWQPYRRLLFSPPVFIVLLLTILPRGVNADGGFIQSCPLLSVPILTVGMDEKSGAFYYMGNAVYQDAGGATGTNGNVTNHTRRRRRRHLTGRHDADAAQLPKDSSSSESVASMKRLRQHAERPGVLLRHNASTLQNNASSSVSGSTNTSGSSTSSSNDNNDPVFYVRECGCFAKTRDLTHRFCPAIFDTCGIPNDALHDINIPVACFASQTLHREILRTAWPILLVWIAIVTGICCLTDVGMDARHYVLRACCCFSNDMMVDRILQAPPESRLRRRRQAFLNSYVIEVGLHQPIAVSSSSSGATIPPPPPAQIPTALELKTKRYKAPYPTGNEGERHTQDDEEDGHEEGASCTICFHPLEDGDRIGALECSHSFHVDCLKSWLSRRNTCPLCQAPDVAATRYEEALPPVHDNTNAAAQPMVFTQVSPFVNPFSSGLIRQQVMRNMEARRQQAAAAATTTTTTPATTTESLPRGRDGFRGVTILPQR